ncbi:MAG: NADH-quinone oxidoreductase subunit H [Candidatus Omnitrophica bacterium]|nr:NADH-quinone oxidoreductase subunit H [Candidatus Omnitrophota bacterium]
MKTLYLFILYLIGAPLVGAWLAGWDRRLSARLQSRVGPPILQPVYDVLKLTQKENMVVRRSQNFYIAYYLIFVIFTGALFFTGQDMLLIIFSLMLASVFFVLAGFKASSPYSFIGAQRELVQIMAYEPAVIFAAIGMYMVTGTFEVSKLAQTNHWLILSLPGIFFAYLFILAMKLRKSPFDISTSHHGHQEVVKGITTEFSGKALAMIEVAHWYETTFILGIVYLFFAKSVVAGLSAALAAYVFMVFVDNAFARVKWPLALASSWIVAFLCGAGNMIWLFFTRH